MTGMFLTRGKHKSQDEKPEEVRVLYFECNVQDADVGAPTLLHMYRSSKEGNYPLGIKLHLNPDAMKLYNICNVLSVLVVEPRWMVNMLLKLLFVEL